MIMRSIPTAKEESEIGNHPMTLGKEGEEALHMMRGDTGRDQTPGIEEVTMVPADLGGEGTAGRVCISRGLLLQAPLLPRDQCC